MKRLNRIALCVSSIKKRDSEDGLSDYTAALGLRPKFVNVQSHLGVSSGY
jgi:hypothetical protein